MQPAPTAPVLHRPTSTLSRIRTLMQRRPGREAVCGDLPPAPAHTHTPFMAYYHKVNLSWLVALFLLSDYLVFLLLHKGPEEKVSQTDT